MNLNELNSIPILTREQALTEHEFHHNTIKNADGSCQRWRRNGATQTWKRSPERFRIPVKHGLYRYGQITEDYADQVHTPADCPNPKH